MVLAKYVKSNQVWGAEEEGLVKGHFYEVAYLNKENPMIKLKGFEKRYNQTCFEFYEAKRKNINFNY